ncbi:ATP-binding protein [Sphaerochaeta halotolerans]|jgi:anti-sigma regulatory factor (Ser/Thr protein kinase)|uniref:Anti-sigma regulatory factor n=1 Tax=Sphaerochaeta halotolerans TaxID=2293840 RepID=A0A372MK34_9SPIR|nr:ATP-binding protein [Sphaerochaeta halotolerans]MBG0766500.1 ATP-binding protein [Spirochaetaceae bacterium]MDK2859263.1 serine/threonine-protein kinase RsbT [Sphaerochaeta sp.]MDN5332818.1 serine/threonine-protein kinase RsbT [Sphaerochaeta sp.]MXI85161.1 anti-sigma regulatory factor [Sphaerochaeta halotolerans]RFU95748.1 anti-sigma regulatory factor [Sphaerochaeta halotolerans]
MHQEYTVPAQDFSVAGVASSNFKRLLKQLNLPPKVIKRITVAVFEAEVNVIAHSYGGKIVCELSENTITVEVIDTGPGIPNLDLAMKEGWSTATEEILELGYGAGMGLPNIKKSCDRLSIKTQAGGHTHITMGFDLKEES